MLHRRVEGLTNQVFETGRIHDHLASTVTVKGFPQELAYAIRIGKAIRDAALVIESLVLPAEVVVAQLLDRQEALQACVHVTVERVVLQADDSFAELFVVAARDELRGGDHSRELGPDSLGALSRYARDLALVHRCDLDVVLGSDVHLLDGVVVLVDDDIFSIGLLLGGLTL